MSILYKPITLKLNKHWLPLRAETPETIFMKMSKDAVRALNIEYETLPDGTKNFSNAIDISPMEWDAWLKLPVREYDNFIQSAKQKIRVPTVVICTTYKDVPMKKPACNNQNIYNRDGGICQYSGKRLSQKQATVDHVIPRSKGGKSIWENLVLCDKEINLAKGNMSNEEAGLTLLKKPKAPKPVCAAATFSIENIAHRDWAFFLFK